MTETSGISKLNLKRANRRQILNILRNNGPISRVDIANHMEITKAAVTIIVNEMIAEGIIIEVGGDNSRPARSIRGRKKILIDIKPLYKLNIGLVIDAGVICCGICTLKGESVEHHMVSIDPGMSSDELIATIKEIYEKLLYKNSISQNSLTGVGICVDEQYFSLLGIKKGPGGAVDYSGFEELTPFIEASRVYGNLTAGLAIAECDYGKLFRRQPKKLLLFRYDSRHSCSLCVNQELYDGDFSHASLVGALPCFATGLPFQEICSGAVFSQKIRALFSFEQTPSLWTDSKGDFFEAKRLLNDRNYEPKDLSVVEIYQEAALCCGFLMRQMNALFQPDMLILFQGEDSFGSFLSYLLKNLAPGYKEQGVTLRESLFSGDSVYLGGAALASRKFFIETGGC